MITLRNHSSAEIRRAADESNGKYTLLAITRDKVESVDIQRLIQVADDTGAAVVYADYVDAGSVVPLIEHQLGSVRDDFDFGPVILVRTAVLKSVVKQCAADYKAAGFYDMWLRIKAASPGGIVHLPETVTRISSRKEASDGEAQFNYVDPRNRESQIEMEQAFTNFLTAIHAKVAPGTSVSHAGNFPVEVSVVIPVRNRVKTVADAIHSALNQETGFPFNVLVVDNHSTDGTTELIDSIAAGDRRLVRITPAVGHGIGGCWNEALDSQLCGRFAVQLDSDDVYASSRVLQTIVDKFRETGAATVIGSYTLTDFDLNVIPPGVIAHTEWTDLNGANNALRINGLGAPRAFFTPIARELRFPDTCYGEDYAMALRISRRYRIARIFDSLYFCRRWGGNSDSNLSREKINANNLYKDWIRTVELCARRNGNN